jgi:hypothetical protein
MHLGTLSNAILVASAEAINNAFGSRAKICVVISHRTGERNAVDNCVRSICLTKAGP